MSTSPLVSRVSELLMTVGYLPVTTPFRVASVEFKFTAAFRGGVKRSNDLVVVVDTATGDHGDRNPKRVRHRIEALGRALDVAQSRFVITAILIGPAARSDVEELAETCRVLTVDGIPFSHTDSVTEKAINAMLADRISVLLPLVLPKTPTHIDAEEHSTITELNAALPQDVTERFSTQIIAASDFGEDAVSDAFIELLEAELFEGVEND